VALDSLSFRHARVSRGATEPPFYSRATVAIASGDSARRAAILAESKSGVRDPLPAWFVASYAEDLNAASQLTRDWLDQPRTLAGQALGHQSLGVLALAGGRWRAGMQELAVAQRHAERAQTTDRHTQVRQMRAVCAVLPFFAAPTREVEAIRRDVAADDADPTRLFLLGILDARLGAHDAAARHAAQLERMDVAPAWRGARDLMARGIRASVALHRGNASEVLTALGTVPTELPVHLNQLEFADVYSRWLRAEALNTLGRDEEALRWYTAAIEDPEARPTLELVLLAPSYLRRAEINARQGNQAGAVEHYSRFRRLWADADPELRGVVQTAGERLEQLQPDARSRRTSP